VTTVNANGTTTITVTGPNGIVISGTTAPGVTIAAASASGSLYGSTGAAAPANTPGTSLGISA
jgi:hypothetical protein